jgi:iron(II)-dependent oxidoreductase
MHAETLAYMLHQLRFDQKRRVRPAPVPHAAPLRTGVAEIPAGRATLGISRHDTESFGWDNEYDATTVEVPAFALDRHKVTNGQYLKFVDAGGYQERGLWTSDAWDWKARVGIEHPLFWSKNGAWSYRSMFREMPLPLD